jgi:hypothetical protein
MEGRWGQESAGEDTVGRVGVDISPLGVISVEIGVISNHHS